MEITLLYASLLTILAVFLAFKAGSTRGKTNTMLGYGDSAELLQSIRAHGNLIENAPLVLILMGLLEMQSIADWKLHILGSLFFLFRISPKGGYPPPQKKRRVPSPPPKGGYPRSRVLP